MYPILQTHYNYSLQFYNVFWSFRRVFENMIEITLLITYAVTGYQFTDQRPTMWMQQVYNSWGELPNYEHHAIYKLDKLFRYRTQVVFSFSHSTWTEWVATLRLESNAHVCRMVYTYIFFFLWCAFVWVEVSQIRGLISLLVREVVVCFCVCVTERKRNSESESEVVGRSSWSTINRRPYKI